MIENVEVEKEIEKYSRNPALVQKMKCDEFYSFLYNCFYVWKYTSKNRLKTCRNCLSKEKDNKEYRNKLCQIKNSIFESEKNNVDDYRNLLKKVMNIPGLGVAGASGLLAILFPDKYGTVDQFLVKALKCIDGLDEEDSKNLENIKKIDDLTVSDAVVLQSIICKKAN